MSKKELLKDGLTGLLNPEGEAPAKAPKLKTVCYYIAPELDEKIRYIAYYDRKKIAEVVAEAFKAYIEKWTPAPNPKPRKL